MRGPSEQCIYLYPDYCRKDGLLTRLFLQQSWQHSRVAICHRKYSTFHSFTASCCPPPLALFSIRASFQGSLGKPQWQNGFFCCFPSGAQPCAISIILDRSYIFRPPLSSLYCLLFVMFTCMQCSARNSQMIVVSQEIFYIQHMMFIQMISTQFRTNIDSAHNSPLKSGSAESDVKRILVTDWSAGI